MIDINVSKGSKIFDKAYNETDAITYGGRLTSLLNNEDLEVDDHASIIDYKGRRVLLYSTLLGVLLVVEDKGLSGINYYIMYSHKSLLSHILPFRIIGHRDLVYICGDEEDDVPNIMGRVHSMMYDLEYDYFEHPELED